MSETCDSEAKEKQLIAEGWERLDALAPNGFNAHVGPYWRRRDEQGVEMGLLVREELANDHLGTIHGGVVMTFADIGLGCAVADALGEERFRAVTASLQTQFIAVARVGELITVRPELVHQGKNMLFARGLIKAGDKTVASAEGIWKLLDKR